ncbi:UNVERIFIED_ORG: hypothetical protein ABIC97_000728 [Peribacillus simplex]
MKDLVEDAAYYVTDKASDTKNFIVDKAIDTKDFVSNKTFDARYFIVDKQEILGTLSVIKHLMRNTLLPKR